MVSRMAKKKGMVIELSCRTPAAFEERSSIKRTGTKVVLVGVNIEHKADPSQVRISDTTPSCFFYRTSAPGYGESLAGRSQQTLPVVERTVGDDPSVDQST